MSITVQQDATVYSFIIFLQAAVHVSDYSLIHHQEHTQTVITTSGTVRTAFGTVRRRGGVVPTGVTCRQQYQWTVSEAVNAVKSS